ncbi:MAG: collagen-like protein [Clostridia bacterium]|nr:collagen-like protein [Clostridia bacterium]
MADKIFLNARYAFRSDTFNNWQNANPILEKGEPAVVTDGTHGEWLKIGDGVTPFNSLQWKKGPKGEQGLQGIKGDKGEKGERGADGKDGKDAVIDRVYSPTSENAQSGIAVAEAVAEKPWTLIEDITLTEAVTQISIPWEKLQVKELYIEGTIIPVETTKSTQTISFGLSGTTYWQGSANPKGTGKIHVTMQAYKSPSGFTIFDGIISIYPYTSGGVHFIGRSENFKGDYVCTQTAKNLWIKSTVTADTGFDIGTNIRFWGR